MNIPMNQEQYAIFWDEESKNFNLNGIYEKLVNLLPDGKVLEIGCGNGLGTHYLSQKHDVLSLDNNQYLINKATDYLNAQEDKYQIHKCDLFQLSNKDRKIIQKFQPNIIVGWFIGASGESVNKYIEEEYSLAEKAKLYREKIEDIIVSNNILIDSIEIINFVIRGAMPVNISNKEIFTDQKKDYDTYVFKDVNFEVNNVTIIDWNIEKSNFRYAVTANPNIPNNIQLKHIVTSISAIRIKNI